MIFIQMLASAKLDMLPGISKFLLAQYLYILFLRCSFCRADRTTVILIQSYDKSVRKTFFLLWMKERPAVRDTSQANTKGQRCQKVSPLHLSFIQSELSSNIDHKIGAVSES